MMIIEEGLEGNLVRLGVEDEEALAAWQLNMKPTVAGIQVPLADRWLNQYLEGGYQALYAYQPNNDPGSWTQVVLTSISPSLPMWHVIAIHRPQYRGVDLFDEARRLLWNGLINHMLSRGYRMFSTCYDAERVSAFRRLWKQANMEKDGWRTITAMTIQPNVRPPFEEVFNVCMGRMLWPIPMAYRVFFKTEEV